MSTTTNLGLFKHDNPATNTNAFDVKGALNDNWDKIDENAGDVEQTLQQQATTISNINTTLNTEITNRQNADSNLQEQIEVEKARIDNITQLEEGSTTGDAELQDIRTGFDGNNYNTAGNSVRKQITNIHYELEGNYALEIKELLQTSNATFGKYYSHNTNNIGEGSAYVIFEPINVFPGITYILKNCMPYFSNVIYDDNTKNSLTEISNPMTVANFEFTPIKCGKLYITCGKVHWDNNIVMMSNGTPKWSIHNNNNKYLDSKLYENDIIKNEIYVSNDGTGDFIKVVDAINSVPNFSKNQYIIYVKEGTYDLLSELGGDTFLNSINENSGNRNGLDLISKNVKIVGIGNVILNMLIPDEKTTQYTAEKISAIECAYNCELENLTINVQNCRYGIHDETGNNSNYANSIHKFKNIKVKHLGNREDVWQSTAAFAAGTSSGCIYEFKDCRFIASDYLAWSMHNNENQSPITVSFDGCVFNGRYQFNGDNFSLSVKFGYYKNNTNFNNVFIKNCIASYKIGVRKEISNVESDNVWNLYNFTDIETVVN